ncbi:MAG TPA: tetratricopeptide repeat protein [Xanthobacteraceae bacterium]|nr:tetratricopeptide repeat protein [Xanthobacteraceae bacterium]
MQLDTRDRPVPELKVESRSFGMAALVIVVLCVAGVTVAVPQARDAAKGLFFVVREALGLGSPDAYAAVYRHLGMAPLPASLRASSQVSTGLERLVREPCDKTAIFSFGEGLLAAHEPRAAADAYVGFAAGCPNGEGEQYRAAEILFQLGDSEKVIAIADGLVTRNPTIAAYRYLRGKARAGTNRYAEAIEDYKSTIELQKNSRDVGDWVFVEMANIYAAMGRPCEAATTILAWIAIDPSLRDTPTARKRAEAYAGQGCAGARPPSTTQL